MRKLRGEEATVQATALCPEPSLKGPPGLLRTLPVSCSLVRVDWHPRPHGAPTSTTSSTLNGHLLRQTRCTFIPHFTDDKWNAHGFPKVTQIWGSWTTALGGCHLEVPTVDGRVLSPCWPHEYAELVF